MSSDSRIENRGHPHPDPHVHLVEVTVDGDKKMVLPQKYVVSEFKELVGVPAEKELEQLIDGKLTPLDDTAHIKIKGHEKFVSHVRAGGSS